MAYLLRALDLLMIIAIYLTVATAHGLVSPLGLGHIALAIPTFLYCIFAQAFVMFYFIGVGRLTENIHMILSTKTNLDELFEDEAPQDLGPYLKKAKQFFKATKVFKRQTIPWTGLMLVLGMLGFFLGAAHDTQLVDKTIHSGVVYGFLVAGTIGFVRQWYYLGKAHKLLRKVKAQFSIPDHQM